MKFTYIYICNWITLLYTFYFNKERKFVGRNKIPPSIQPPTVRTWAQWQTQWAMSSHRLYKEHRGFFHTHTPGFEFLYYPSCAQNVFFIYVLASICMALETKPNKKQQALGTSGPKWQVTRCKHWTLKKKKRVTLTAGRGIVLLFIHRFMIFLVILLIFLKT